MPDLVSALNRVDLPTLGRPTMPHFKLMIFFRQIKIQRRDFNIKAGCRLLLAGKTACRHIIGGQAADGEGRTVYCSSTSTPAGGVNLNAARDKFGLVFNWLNWMVVWLPKLSFSSIAANALPLKPMRMNW